MAGTLRQPCAPREADTRLQLKVSTIHEDRLAELASHVNAHLFKKEQYKVQKFAHGYVEMEFRLLLETLHKLLRYDAIPRFRHEMGERLTEYSAEDLTRAILMALPQAAVEVLAKTSEGFRTAYIEAGLAIRNAQGQPVPMPFSHVQVSGVSLVRGADSPEAPPQSGDTPAVRQPGRMALRNAGMPGGLPQAAGPASENLPEVDEVRKQLRNLSPPFLEISERALATKERALVAAADAIAVAAAARAAVVAKRPDYLDIVPKVRESVPLFPSNRKEKPVFLETLPTGTGSEAIGILVYGTYDEFQGRFLGQSPYGLGAWKVYPHGHSFTPNDIHYYRGQVEGKHYRGIGIYEFGPAQYAAGDWVDDHPHFGVMAPCRHPALFDYYCGSLGTVEREKGDTLWVPHGDGVGISLPRNEIVFGSFHYGEALKNCQTVPLRPGLGSPSAPAATAQTGSPPRGSAPAASVPVRPCPQGSDMYRSFSALAGAEDPESFAVSVERRNSAVAVMAPPL
jgi:hypothetical protein